MSYKRIFRSTANENNMRDLLARHEVYLRYSHIRNDNNPAGREYVIEGADFEKKFIDKFVELYNSEIE